LLYDYPVDNLFFYYKVVELGGTCDVFVVKTRLNVGRKYRGMQEITATNFDKASLILRPLPHKKDLTKTRPSVRMPQRCFAMAR
jgi:hypothetical protein